MRPVSPKLPLLSSVLDHPLCMNPSMEPWLPFVQPIRPVLANIAALQRF